MTKKDKLIKENKKLIPIAHTLQKLLPAIFIHSTNKNFECIFCNERLTSHAKTCILLELHLRLAQWEIEYDIRIHTNTNLFMNKSIE